MAAAEEWGGGWPARRGSMRHGQFPGSGGPRVPPVPARIQPNNNSDQQQHQQRSTSAASSSGVRQPAALRASERAGASAAWLSSTLFRSSGGRGGRLAPRRSSTEAAAKASAPQAPAAAAAAAQPTPRSSSAQTQTSSAGMSSSSHSRHASHAQPAAAAADGSSALEQQPPTSPNPPPPSPPRAASPAHSGPARDAPLPETPPSPPGAAQGTPTLLNVQQHLQQRGLKSRFRKPSSAAKRLGEARAKHLVQEVQGVRLRDMDAWLPALDPSGREGLALVYPRKRLAVRLQSGEHLLAECDPRVEPRPPRDDARLFYTRHELRIFKDARGLARHKKAKRSSSSTSNNNNNNNSSGGASFLAAGGAEGAGGADSDGKGRRRKRARSSAETAETTQRPSSGSPLRPNGARSSSGRNRAALREAEGDVDDDGLPEPRRARPSSAGQGQSAATYAVAQRPARSPDRGWTSVPAPVSAAAPQAALRDFVTRCIGDPSVADRLFQRDISTVFMLKHAYSKYEDLRDDIGISALAAKTLFNEAEKQTL